MSDPPNPDFNNTAFDVQIPVNSVSVDICQFLVYDNNIDEDEQAFAIVAEILDVPENVICFQIGLGNTKCLGSRRATRIRIIDNDGKHFVVLILEIVVIFYLQPWLLASLREL